MRSLSAFVFPRSHLELDQAILQLHFSGCLQFLACFWWLPVTLDIEFGVVVSIICVHSFLGPEIFEANILGESVHGEVQLGLGKWFLEAEFEAIPEEFSCAWWWLEFCAEVVESNLVLFVECEEFWEGHFAKYYDCSLPGGEFWICPDVVLVEGVE